MALSWPLPAQEFFDDLPIAEISFTLGRASEFSETGGGDVIDHRLGARLWQGRIKLDIDTHAAWAAIEARLALLEEPGASLLLYDTRLPSPIAHPALAPGALDNVQIGAIAANNRELSLTRLPQGYTVSRGDVLGFTYGANPTRYAYHRVVTGAVADVSGVAAWIEVTPFLRPGAVAGLPVALQAPVLKAKIKEAAYGASRATISEGGAFSWTQTLR
jgi:hypothetical protein